MYRSDRFGKAVKALTQSLPVERDRTFIVRGRADGIGLQDIKNVRQSSLTQAGTRAGLESATPQD
jgi:hypothetical protein